MKYRKPFQKIPFSKLFFKYFFSYLLLTILLCFFIIFIGFDYITDAYQEQVTRFNLLKMEQTRNTLDAELFACSQTAQKISEDTTFLPSQVDSSPYSKIELTQMLRKYRASTGILQDISIVYFDPDVDLVFSTMGTVRKTDMSSLIGLSFDQVQGMSAELSSPVFVQSGGMAENPFFSGNLHYIFPKPYDSTGSPYAAVIFTLSGQEILDMLQLSYQNETGHAFVYSSNRILLSDLKADQKSFAEPIFSSLFSTEKKGLYQETFGTEPFTFVKTPSQYTELGYAVVMREPEFLRVVTTFRSNLYFFVLILIGLGAAISVLMATKNYRPIRLLSDLVKGKRNGKKPQLRNELQNIYDEFEHFCTEREELKNQLYQNENMMKDYAVAALLHGTGRPAAIANTAELDCFEVSGARYVVLCFLLDHFSTISQDPSLVHFHHNTLRRLLSELCPEGLSLHFSAVYEPYAAAVLAVVPESFEQDKLVAFLRAVQSAYQDETKSTVSAAVSDAVEQRSKVPHAFAHASYASKYRLLSGWNSLILYDDLVRNGSVRQAESLAEENIRNVVLSGNLLNFTKLLETDFMHDGPASTPEQLTNEYYKFLRVMKQICQQMLPEETELYEQAAAISSTLPETAKGMYTVLLEYGARLLGTVRQTQSRKSDLFRKKVVGYIQENYRDNSLSLSVIADEVGVTPPYLSRRFKEETGCTVMNYLDQVRMELATKLLKESDTPVKDVVSACGYVDINNFIRKFKKMYGVTPAIYREENRVDKP